MPGPVMLPGAVFDDAHGGFTVSKVICYVSGGIWMRAYIYFSIGETIFY